MKCVNLELGWDNSQFIVLVAIYIEINLVISNECFVFELSLTAC